LRGSAEEYNVAFVSLALCLFVAILGALGLASPERFTGVVRRFQTLTGLYVAVAFRLVLGVALFVSAPDSRNPDLLRILGVLFFMGGLVLPLIGPARFRWILEFFVELGPGVTRAWGALALVLGLLLAYAVVP
jgi:hypothetical protein